MSLSHSRDILPRSIDTIDYPPRMFTETNKANKTVYASAFDCYERLKWFSKGHSSTGRHE